MVARLHYKRRSGSLRDEALLMLEGRGSVLETARDVSRILREQNIPGAVIGGVSVVLHGHVRTTSDVDVYVPAPLSTFADHLGSAGYVFDSQSREFVRDKVPVQLVSSAQAIPVPSNFVLIDDVQTVSLADLINLKLRSGLQSVLRSQNLADVIALIRANQLDGRFAARIAMPLRAEFNKLLLAVRSASERRRSDDDNPHEHLS